MTASLESSIVRFRKSNGAVVGAGFLVLDKHVLTCAHVVADALGIARDTQDSPTEDVYLDFPLVDSETQLTARVVFWSPVPPKGSTSVKGKEDIAGLELKSTLPKGVQPVGLVSEEDLREHSFRTFGFPSGHDDGLEATGVLRGRQGTGWVQLEGVTQTGVRLEPGFSGAPVWDEKLNRVVGMAVAADQKRPEAKVAFMIPTKVLASAWDRLLPEKRFPVWRETSWRLTSLALIPVLGVTVFSIPQVQTALKIRQPSCFDIARKEGKKAIAVAKFHNDIASTIINPHIEADIIDRLEAQRWNDLKVCRINQSVSLRDEAKNLGSNLDAALLIWGRRSGSTLTVNVTTVKLDVRHLTKLSLVAATSLDFDEQTRDWQHLVPVMSGFALSQIYENEEQLQEAIDTLQNVLSLAESMELDLSNEDTIKVMSKAYFFLGQLYSPTTDFYCSNKTNCEKGLVAYKTALRWNKTYDSALRGLGTLYHRLGKLSEAITIYTQIIQLMPDSPLSFGARMNRAEIYLEQGNTSEAIKDFKFVCQRQPDSHCLRSLGFAQLQSKDFGEATKTYQSLMNYLSKDETTKTAVIQDLKSFAKDRPDSVTAINSLIANLQR